jgi:hypothetical protein
MALGAAPAFAYGVRPASPIANSAPHGDGAAVQDGAKDRDNRTGPRAKYCQRKPPLIHLLHEGGI